jgi:hypothetical protein
VLLQSGLALAHHGPGTHGEPSHRQPLALRAVQCIQQVAHALGKRGGRAQIDFVLPPLDAIHHAKVGAKSPVPIGSPPGHDRSPGGEKCWMGKQLRPHALEPGFEFLSSNF